jgi:hypothetical protein
MKILLLFVGHCANLIDRSAVGMEGIIEFVHPSFRERAKRGELSLNQSHLQAAKTTTTTTTTTTSNKDGNDKTTTTTTTPTITAAATTTKQQLLLLLQLQLQLQ